MTENSNAPDAVNPEAIDIQETDSENQEEPSSNEPLCNKRRWQVFICLCVVALLLVLLAIISFSLARCDPGTCCPTKLHFCMCEGDDFQQPIIIEGDSVSVLEKQFSDEEI